MKISHGQVALTGNGTHTVDLPTTHFMKRILLRISVTMTNTGSVNFHADALARLFHFRVFIGTAPAFDIRGDDLRHYFDHHNGIGSDYTEFAAGAGAQTATWNVEIPFSDLRLPRPHSTMVDMRLADSPRIEIVEQGATAATAGTSVFTSGTIDVSTDVALVPADLEAVRVLAMRRFRTVSITDLSASQADQAKKGITGALVRAYMFRVVDKATAKAASDLLIDSIETVVNHQETGRFNWTDMKTLTRNIYRINPATGVAFLCFDPAFTLDASSMLDLRGARDIAHQFATLAAANNIDVRITEEQIIPPDAAAAAAVLDRLAAA